MFSSKPRIWFDDLTFCFVPIAAVGVVVALVYVSTGNPVTCGNLLQLDNKLKACTMHTKRSK